MNGARKYNYLFLVIVAGAGPYINLVGGADCNIIVFPTPLTEGFTYFDLSRGHGAIRFFDDYVFMGGSANDVDFAEFGFAVFGLLRIK